MKYQLQNDRNENPCAVEIVGQLISIPFDNANSDFTQFKKDLANGAELFDAEGNVIDGIAYLATLES